jgi:hypothetical protein
MRAAVTPADCRREGHKPAFQISDTSTLKITSMVTTCVRCGKAIEVKA